MPTKKPYLVVLAEKRDCYLVNENEVISKLTFKDAVKFPYAYNDVIVVLMRESFLTGVVFGELKATSKNIIKKFVHRIRQKGKVQTTISLKIFCKKYKLNEKEAIARLAYLNVTKG